MYVASVALPVIACSITLLLVGRACREGRSWGRVALAITAGGLEVVLLVGW